MYVRLMVDTLDSYPTLRCARCDQQAWGVRFIDEVRDGGPHANQGHGQLLTFSLALVCAKCGHRANVSVAGGDLCLETVPDSTRVARGEAKLIL